MKTKPDIASAVSAIIDLHDREDVSMGEVRNVLECLLADLIGTSDVNKARKYLDGLLGIE